MKIRLQDGFSVEHWHRARFLRSKGATLREISVLLDRPISTIAGWTEDVERPPLEELVSFKHQRKAA